MAAAFFRLVGQIRRSDWSDDTVLKKCVSSKVLIFVVNKKIKERTMKLTSEQRSELISEMASSEAGFKELVRVLLDSFSKQEGNVRHHYC